MATRQPRKIKGAHWQQVKNVRYLQSESSASTPSSWYLCSSGRAAWTEPRRSPSTTPSPPTAESPATPQPAQPKSASKPRARPRCWSSVSRIKAATEQETMASREISMQRKVEIMAHFWRQRTACVTSAPNFWSISFCRCLRRRLSSSAAASSSWKCFVARSPKSPKLLDNLIRVEPCTAVHMPQTSKFSRSRTDTWTSSTKPKASWSIDRG